MSATRQITVLNRLPRNGETVKFWIATNAVVDMREGQYLVEITGPTCDCDGGLFGALRTHPSCPVHGEGENPREPREDDSLAQEYVIPPVHVSHERLLADLSYLLTDEDARIVEAYLLGVSQGGNMNRAGNPS